MAQARTTLGQRGVSQLQYNPGPAAQTTVDASALPTFARGKPRSEEDGNDNDDDDNGVEGKAKGSGDGGEGGAGGLRRRGKKGKGKGKDTKSSSGGDSGENNEEEDEGEKQLHAAAAAAAGERTKKKGPLDPLKWFGFLTPSTLRNCQASFETMIDRALEVATTRAQMIAVRRDYEKLLKEKAAAGGGD